VRIVDPDGAALDEGGSTDDTGGDPVPDSRVSAAGEAASCACASTGSRGLFGLAPWLAVFFRRRRR
jgi:hypothetical protein